MLLSVRYGKHHYACDARNQRYHAGHSNLVSGIQMADSTQIASTTLP